jgi:SagB-type dehydrogenase family enzyme
MNTSHPFATDNTEDVKVALDYLVNSFMHKGEGRSVKLDLRYYLEVANRVRTDGIFPFVKLPRFQDCSTEYLHSQFSDAVTTRESVREFETKPMSLEDLSRLLFLSAGIRRVDDHGSTFRHWPSAGGLFPINLLICVQNVEGLSAGVYSYEPLAHGLRHLRGESDSRECVSLLLGGQPWIQNASCAILLCADLDKTLWKYGGRGLRYVLLDCGHLGQNLSLCAHAIGAGSCAIGGFCENELHQKLGLAVPDESVMYALAVGIPKKSNQKPGPSTERYL